MSSIVHINPTQKKALTHAVLIAVIFGAFFLRSYFIVFVIAAILAYLFMPLYDRLRKKLKSGSAALITLLTSMLAILIPTLVVIILALSQVRSLSSTVSTWLVDFDITQTSGQVIDGVNSFLASTPFSGTSINEDSIKQAITKSIEFFGKHAVGFLSSAVGSSITLVSLSIIFIYIFFSLIVNGPKLVQMLRGLNPLGDDVADLYLRQIGAMVKGTVFGQLVIALVQGFLAAVTVSLVTKPSMFFVMFIVFTAMSIIPLGAGILVMPIGIVLMLFGNFVGGLIILLEHLVVNTNVDNILRPILVPEEAKLDPALMLVSVFAGIAMFGFLGIVIGPTLMILIVTTIKVYIDVNKVPQLKPETVTVSQPKKTSPKKRR